MGLQNNVVGPQNFTRLKSGTKEAEMESGGKRCEWYAGKDTGSGGITDRKIKMKEIK